jgi:hypothetical protein
MKNITVQAKDKTEEMSLETYARWLCLMECIHIVCKKADELKIPTDRDLSWVKPISFQKYMDDRFTSMMHEIEMDHGLFKGGLEKLGGKINFDLLDKKQEVEEVDEEVNLEEEVYS